MDSPATTQMLTSRDIRVLHLEPTDVCQARCPQCARNIDPNFDAHQHHHLSLDQLQSILPDGFIENLDKMFMCGNYGDPAAGYHTLKIFKHFRNLNPDIVLGIHSNGGIGTTFWWHDLGQLLNGPQDYAVFSIDGLEDTNGDYRINVQWRKVMQNAEAFIAAGGRAHWDMLIYRHNEHQVGACLQLAKDMGFRWFRTKVSKRPLIGRLQHPVTWAPPQADTDGIDCQALKERSIYIDAQGRVSPCCWLGSRQRDFVTDFDLVQTSWSSASPNPVCVKQCSGRDGRTNFSDQWRQEIAL